MMTWITSNMPPPNGCGFTITNAQTWRWAVSPQHNGSPWPH